MQEQNLTSLTMKFKLELPRWNYLLQNTNDKTLRLFYETPIHLFYETPIYLATILEGVSDYLAKKKCCWQLLSSTLLGRVLFPFNEVTGYPKNTEHKNS